MLRDVHSSEGAFPPEGAYAQPPGQCHAAAVRLFKRSQRIVRADEHLTYFTTAQARQFRRLVANSFAKVGRDVTVYPDHVDDRTGTTFGLWNIGALCAGHDELEWPDLIDDHIQRVTTPPRDLEDLTEGEFVSGLYAHIVEAGSQGDNGSLAYAREVAPGLLEVLAEDLPESVSTLPEDELAAHGDVSRLMERGRDNLRGLLGSGEVGAEVVELDHDGRFTAVTGRSFFTASLALLLPETMERFTREGDVGRGVLVAVPSRNMMLYRVIDGPGAAEALERMFEIAQRGFSEEAGALSPHVFWVRNHRWIQVTSVGDGKSRVHVSGDLAGAFAPFDQD
jgi:hypothetical protein